MVVYITKGPVTIVARNDPNPFNMDIYRIFRELGHFVQRMLQAPVKYNSRNVVL
jgi:hypothetical protein